MYWLKWNADVSRIEAKKTTAIGYVCRNNQGRIHHIAPETDSDTLILVTETLASCEYVHGDQLPDSNQFRLSKVPSQLGRDIITLAVGFKNVRFPTVLGEPISWRLEWLRRPVIVIIKGLYFVINILYLSSFSKKKKIAQYSAI